MALTPTAKKEFRREVISYCKLAEQYEQRWHYSQRRPYTGLGDAPQTHHVNDCSSYVALVFYWSGRHSMHTVRDPLNQHYSGWGYTGTSIDYLEEYPAGGSYRVGDIAFYGPSRSNTTHMTVCRKGGTGDTAVWSSHGQEAGPQAVKLRYRSDLVGVYRHPALR